MSTKATEIPNIKTAETSAAAGGRRVVFDDSSIKSSYANVCTATTTREEVVLNFGINQAWERAPTEMKVDLTHRIILSPFAAARLHKLLSSLMREYQTRYGELKDAEAPADR